MHRVEPPEVHGPQEVTAGVPDSLGSVAEKEICRVRNPRSHLTQKGLSVVAEMKTVSAYEQASSYIVPLVNFGFGE